MEFDMTVPYMQEPETRDPESLALINAELRKRLFKAARIITERNAQLKELQGQEGTAVSEEAAATEDDIKREPDDEAMLRAIYGYEGTQEYLELTEKIGELEEKLHTSEMIKAEVQDALEKTIKGAEMKEAELREIILGVRTETRKKDRKITQLKGTLRNITESHSNDGMSLQLIVSSMHAAGLEAQLSAFRKAHSGSDLMQPNAASSDPSKSRLRLIYEDAFDAKGIELGVMNPKAHRAAPVKSPT